MRNADRRVTRIFGRLPQQQRDQDSFHKKCSSAQPTAYANGVSIQLSRVFIAFPFIFRRATAQLGQILFDALRAESAPNRTARRSVERTLEQVAR